MYELEGWVKLHRQLLDSKVFANESLLKLWIYCLCRANHEKTEVPIDTGRGETEVTVLPGQFIFGRKKVARDLNVNESSLYKRIKKLEKMGNINTQSNTHYSIVTICNWASYQDKKKEKEQPKEHPSNNQVTGKEQPSNTDKNDKNVKKRKPERSTGKEKTIWNQDKWKEDDTEYKIAMYLLKKILHNKPDHHYSKRTPALQRWADDADKMLRIDNRDKKAIKTVIDWIFLHDSEKADFWKPNIESVKKLRQNFDRLEMQMNQDSKQSGADRTQNLQMYKEFQGYE